MRHAELLEFSPDLQALAERELRGDERLVWAGQPTFRLLSAGTIAPVLFAVPFTLIAIVWIGATAFGPRVAGAPWPVSLFSLCGLPFVLVGLGMFTAPYWIKRQMRRTVYLVTDQRAVVLRPGFLGGSTSRSFGPDRVASMTRDERADGSGDLVFEVLTTRRGTGVSTTRHGFLSIPRVREVEDVLRRTLLEGRTRPI